MIAYKFSNQLNNPIQNPLVLTPLKFSASQLTSHLAFRNKWKAKKGEKICIYVKFIVRCFSLLEENVAKNARKHFKENEGKKNKFFFFFFTHRTPKETLRCTTQSPRNEMTCWLCCWTMQQTSPLQTTMASTLCTMPHSVEIQGEWNIFDVTCSLLSGSV